MLLIGLLKEPIKSLLEALIGLLSDLTRKFEHLPNSGRHALNQAIGSNTHVLVSTKLQTVKDILQNESTPHPALQQALDVLDRAEIRRRSWPSYNSNAC